MKEAVVLVLDANDSMEAVYDEEKGTSRFDCAKKVVQDMICDLMIRSKTNEVAVIVLKTKKTHHHFFEDYDDNDNENDDDDNENDDDIPFPNLTEMGGDGTSTSVIRPTPELLRHIQKLQATPDSRDLRGDFCDGIIVAADALFRRTSGKKYQRRIVLITDAEHRVEVDHTQLLVVLDSLRAMECRLEVIGLDFEQQAEYDQAASADTAAKLVKRDEGDATKEDDDDDKDSATDLPSNDDQSDDDHGEESEEEEEEQEVDDEEIRLMVKRQNEKLLIGLTEKTGGFVMAAKELHSILQKVLGQRISKSTRRKFLLQLAPGLEFDARFSLLLSKASTPSLTKQIVMVDGEQDKPQNNALGEEMTSDYQTIVSHWDPENEEQEVTELAQGYRYGSDIIPMGGLDLSGLIHISPVKMTLLGYLPLPKVPPELRIGPPYAISGADSRRACAAISALARALRRTNQVGIATMVKSKNADPILIGLFPLEEGDNSPIIHLVFLQLPFQGDVSTRTLPSFERPSKNNASKETACDDLIDALMVPDEALDCTRIPNPYIRSFHQTVVQRVLDPNRPVVSVRPEEGDPMSTPKEVLERAGPALQSFRKTFPLTDTSNNNPQNDTATTKRKKGPATYRDFVDNDED